jgi:hypothetical protein
MSMIFEFGEMSQAEAFVREVKQRWGLDGMTFDDADKAHEHSLFPWVEEPPIPTSTAPSLKSRSRWSARPPSSAGNSSVHEETSEHFIPI